MKRLLDRLLFKNTIGIILISCAMIIGIVMIVKPELISDSSVVFYIACGIEAVLLFILFSLLRSRRGLQTGNERLNHEGDLNLTSEEPPSRVEFHSGGIFCGQEALYSKRDRRLLFYDEILWIYKSLDKVTGVSMGESKFFCTRDGHHYRMHMSEKDMNSLINKYIYPAQPKLILGYSPLNQSEYERRKSDRKGRK